MINFFEWAQKITEAKIGNLSINVDDTTSLLVASDYLEDQGQPEQLELSQRLRFRAQAISEVERNLVTALAVALPNKRVAESISARVTFNLSSMEGQTMEVQAGSPNFNCV